MQLTVAEFGSSRVDDLSPLAGMPLSTLVFNFTDVSDLSPLVGLKLTDVLMHTTKVSDLTPLRGMPIKYLDCHNTAITNLSPLADCTTLKSLFVTQAPVTAAGVAALQKALPNCKIEWDDPAKATPADKK